MFGTIASNLTPSKAIRYENVNLDKNDAGGKFYLSVPIPYKDSIRDQRISADCRSTNARYALLHCFCESLCSG